MRTRQPAAGLPWLAAFVLAVAPAAAPACGSCYSLGGNPLALPHPRAIEIAVATRAAIEAGVIPERKAIPRDTLLEGGIGFVDLHKVPAPRLVQAWAARLGRSTSNNGSLAVHFLFIDTEQSCGLIMRGGAVVFDSNPSFHVDARIVTTRTAFQALVSGGLDAANAERLGLLIVEGDARARSLFSKNASETNEILSDIQSVK